MLNPKERPESKVTNNDQPAVVIKPGPVNADGQMRGQVISKMETAGLIETLPWPRPPDVSEEDRTRLAILLSAENPLSETIIADRGQPDT